MKCDDLGYINGKDKHILYPILLLKPEGRKHTGQVLFSVTIFALFPTATNFIQLSLPVPKNIAYLCAPTVPNYTEDGMGRIIFFHEATHESESEAS